MANYRNFEEYRAEVLTKLGVDYTVEDLRNFEKWRLKVLEGLANLYEAEYYEPKIQEAVEGWLDDHPEATTTVEDGAVTTAKLYNGAVTTDKVADGAITDDKLASNGIKAEVANLKSDLNGGVQSRYVTGITSGGYIKANGDYASNSAFSYGYIYIHDADSIKLIQSGLDDTSVINYYDENKTYLRNSKSWVGNGEYDIPITDNDYYICVSARNADITKIYIDVYFNGIKKTLDDDISYMYEGVRNYNLLNGVWYGTDGILYTQNTYKGTDLIPVRSGIKYIIQNEMQTESTAYLVGFKNGVHVSTNAFTTDAEFTVPDTWDKVAITFPTEKYNESYITLATEYCIANMVKEKTIDNLMIGGSPTVLDWKRGSINSSGVEGASNNAVITTNYLDTSDFDFLLRKSGIKEGWAYYYDYDSSNDTYTFAYTVQFTEGIRYFIDKTHSHFRLRLFDTWSTVVNLTDAPENCKAYTNYLVAEKMPWVGKKWVAVGDSLTEINNKTTKNYANYIVESTGITLVNMGLSGSGYKNQTASGNGAFYQRILNVPTDADIVTIFGSFNDGYENMGTADDTGTDTIAGCINTTIDNLYSILPTVQLGIISPTPWAYRNPYNGTNANVYADVLKEICKKRSIPYLDLYYESNLRPWDSTFRTLAYSKDGGDGTHPDETGHKIIAPRIKAFLESLII